MRMKETTGTDRDLHVCESLDSKLKVFGCQFLQGGAGADLPIPSNEATANQWKHLGTLKCVPAMYRVQPISFLFESMNPVRPLYSGITPDGSSRQSADGSKWLVPFLRVMVFVASRRKFRCGTRLVPHCGITMHLVQQVSGSKTLHRSPGSFCLSSGAAPGVCVCVCVRVCVCANTVRTNSRT